MNQLLLFIGTGLGLLALLLWLAVSRHSERHEPGVPLRIPLEDLVPRHALYISQVRNALSENDLVYLKRHISGRKLRKVRKERRVVARAFLAGLRDDFQRLERLAHIIAAFSPKVGYRQELGRVWLGLRFRVLYVLVWVRLSLGPLPDAPLEGLAGLVGSLSERLEAAMNVLAEGAVARV
jgi:hypothetical protein